VFGNGYTHASRRGYGLRRCGKLGEGKAIEEGDKEHCQGATRRAEATLPSVARKLIVYRRCGRWLWDFVEVEVVGGTKGDIVEGWCEGDGEAVDFQGADFLGDEGECIGGGE